MRVNWVVAFVTLIAIVMIAAPAEADAIGPPPRSCPRGKVPVSDHSGSRCELEAPKCPAGWRGIVGGTCILFLCINDSDCGDADMRCGATDLCFEERPMHWQYHQRGDRNDVVHRGNQLAEPPPPLDPNNKVDVAVDLCGSDRSCKASGATCKPGKLCLPKNVNAPAPRPANADVASGVVPAEKNGGCAGCATADRVSPASLAAVCVAVLGVLMWLSRRRHRVPRR